MKLILVGYGNIAKFHIEAFRSLDVDIIASCNRSEEKNFLAKTEAGIKNTYKSINEMIENESFDGILCCVSYYNIFKVAKILIPLGVPIFLEKPPGTSYDEYETLLDLSRKNFTPVVVGLNRRFYSVIKNAIKDMGGLINVNHIDLSWAEDTAIWINRGVKQTDIKKLLYANSIHGIDLISFLNDDEEIIDLDIKVSILSKKKCKWIICFNVKLQNNLIISYRSTWGIPGRWRLEVCSNEKKYTFAPLEKCIISNFGNEEKTVPIAIEDKNFKPGFYLQANSFLEICKKPTKYKSAKNSLEKINSTMKILSKIEAELDLQLNKFDD